MCFFHIYNCPVVMNLHLFSDQLFDGVWVRERVVRAVGTTLGAKLFPWFPDDRFGKTSV